MTKSFNIIYSGGEREDAYTLLEYIDEFYHGLGVTHCDVDISRLFGVVQASYHDFPTPFGSKAASPFKKVAAFTANFAAEKPIITSLPGAHFGALATHQNAIVAIMLSLDALEGAVIRDGRRGDVVLERRIEVSRHYWKDLVAAVSDCVPAHHFDCLALIYEALAYQANPAASYERVI